jgi:hypothetical protein
LFFFFAVHESGCDLSLNSSDIYLCGAIVAAVGVIGAADGAVGQLVAADFSLGTRLPAIGRRHPINAMVVESQPEERSTFDEFRNVVLTWLHLRGIAKRRLNGIQSRSHRSQLKFPSR